MVLETTLVPRGPYSLADSVRTRGDATRHFRDGVLTAAFEADGSPALAHVWQRRDGALAVRVSAGRPEPALDQLRFILAVDDDHSPFLRRFARDAFLGEVAHRLAGLRPLRTATVAHALLKAICGQLIQAHAARILEARLLRLAAPEHAGLRLPPGRGTRAGGAHAARPRRARGFDARPPLAGARARAAALRADRGGGRTDRA